MTAPNGQPIHILAQSGWRDDQIVRARLVLEHLLENVSGSRFGHNKTAVANAMAERRATLVLFDDEPTMERAFRGPLGEVPLRFQDLRANECPVEGDADYMAHETRDAAFEEILHLVHDQGIRPALPEFDRELQAANLAAAKAGHWKPWPRFEPDSHRSEYFAAAYDNYLDLWAVPPTKYEGEAIPDGEIPAGTSHFGRFGASSRAALKKIDPAAAELIEAFLPRHLTYPVTLAEDFEGTFSIQFTPGLRYTAKSQHFRRVELQGTRPASIVGNDFANWLIGNDGNNELTGGGSNDHLIGFGGIDTVIYRGKRSEYKLRQEGQEWGVIDKQRDRDGSDILIGIEKLRFSDGEVMLETKL